MPFVLYLLGHMEQASFYTSCHSRATATPNQIQPVVFRRKVIKCIWFGTALALQFHCSGTVYETCVREMERVFNFPWEFKELQNLQFLSFSKYLEVFT